MPNPSHPPSDAEIVTARDKSRAASINPKHQPLVSHIYTADPSAHVFNGKIYIYPSHDVENEMPTNDNGDHFDMKDYHVFSLEEHFSAESFRAEPFSAESFSTVTDHGCALDIADVKWAKRQMWAPDTAEKGGKFYLYFPARNHQDIFQI